MSTGKINALLFCATIILAAAPTAIDWGIKEYKESTSTYIGMIMCSDGEQQRVQPCIQIRPPLPM